MVELPYYARIKETVTGDYRNTNSLKCSAVEEDEIVLLKSLNGPGWYQGQKLSGESVNIAADNCIPLIIPELRNTELYFVVSFAEYSSTHHEDISFGKNTLIVVSKELDESWDEGTVIGPNGKRLGRSGLFPKTFVRKLDVDKRDLNTPSSTAHVDTAASSSSILGQTLPLPKKEPVTKEFESGLDGPKAINPSLDIIDERRPYAIAIFPFCGENCGELSFEEGSVLYLHRYLEKGWIKGELNGKVGIFPASYIRIVNDLPQASSVCSKSLRSVSRGSGIGYASVLYDFAGREEDELTVDAGESVSILEMVNDEWALCYDPGRDRSGIIPTAFLSIFLNEDDEEDLSHTESSDSETMCDAQPRGAVMLDSVSPMQFGNKKELPVQQQISYTSDERYDQTPEQLKDLFDGKKSSSGISSAGLNGSVLLTKQKKQPPARPPPPKFGTASKAAAVSFRNTPPPRPVELPKRISLPPNIALEGLEARNASATYRASPTTNIVGGEDSTLSLYDRPVVTKAEISAIDNKKYVINDLISSELQYLSDIGMWEAEVLGSSGVSVEQKKMLTHGFPQLKELSRLLVSRLVEQQSRPPEQQCFGEAFLSLRDEFTRTFGLYFRSVETITNAIVGKDAKLQRALNECVLEMRSLGSNVFDVPTAVSRPIQRCLKYPLFIGELIKGTPLTHTDHPKLLEALKQMSLLASKMNESKRRKELAVKYRNIGTEPLKKRLSRLNMHSVKKKSNRFKYRLSTHMGFVHMEKDLVFDQLAENLDKCERRICKLLHAIQIYRQTIVLQSKKYVEMYSSTERLSGNSSTMNTEIRDYCKQLLQASSSLSQYLDETLGAEAKKFLRLPITKVIQKRYDKLIDYMSAKNENKNSDEIRLRQCDYEALNNQLKATLPKTIENIKKRTLTFVETVILKDMEFLNTFSKLREELSLETRNFLAVPFSTYIGSREVRLRSFVSINKALHSDSLGSTKSSIQGANGDQRQQFLVQKSFLDTKSAPTTKVQSAHSPPLRPVLPKSTTVGGSGGSELVEKNLIDLEDNLLDLVTPVQFNQTVEVRSLETANTNSNLLNDINGDRITSAASINSRSVCDTALVNGTSLPASADVLLNDLFPNEMDRGQILLNLDAPLIPFRPYGSHNIQAQHTSAQRCSDAVSELYPVLESAPPQPAAVQDTESKPSLPNTEVISHDITHYYDKPSEAYSSSGVYDEPYTKLGDHTSISSNSDGDALVPVRIAPPPPSSSKKHSEDDDFLSYRPCRAEFDFIGSTDCHVSLSFGEKVFVLKDHDDANNDEWWLVRKEFGGIGYVPASYLRVI